MRGSRTYPSYYTVFQVGPGGGGTIGVPVFMWPDLFPAVPYTGPLAPIDTGGIDTGGSPTTGTPTSPSEPEPTKADDQDRELWDEDANCFYHPRSGYVPLRTKAG
jgi:hypothetical protein